MNILKPIGALVGLVLLTMTFWTKSDTQLLAGMILFWGYIYSSKD